MGTVGGSRTAHAGIQLAARCVGRGKHRLFLFWPHVQGKGVGLGDLNRLGVCAGVVRFFTAANRTRDRSDSEIGAPLLLFQLFLSTLLNDQSRTPDFQSVIEQEQVEAWKIRAHMTF